MKWETVIGIEIHAELKTKSKIFCGCPTDFGGDVNKQTCPICLGLPGSLPRLNKEVVNLAIKAGLALNCKINNVSKMDRKNYFYADLPKAYQISQYDYPVCTGGYVDIDLDGEKKRIRINRIHIEEDPGKLIHLQDEPFTLVDYNRSGVALIEIVTEADLRSPLEAVQYAKTIKSILEYENISDCRMEEGSLRCDANISIREHGDARLNTKVELKNINSFKELQKALEKEESRQRELYDFNESYKVIQETRRWDSSKGRTISMRKKEDAHDYRYFAEPDIPKLVVDDETIRQIEETLTELPSDKKARFIEDYKLTEKEAEILVGEKSLADYFEEVIKFGLSPKLIANWVLGDLMKLLKVQDTNIGSIPIKAQDISELLKLIEKGDISGKIAKDVLEEMFNTGKEPTIIIEEKGLKQISQGNVLEVIVDTVLEGNIKSIEDYKAGKEQALTFLMGQVMKETKGQANPVMAKEMLLNKIKIV
ncbi:Asp-tRNA(Asn)/Glu-tRNA(Gln) amidotransferase subunit GatB [Serpentinicella alkaliphila]|uniref:Aspartyl/glutamyl-tRNA(Asn/Gln) amidotransferase subunit B n=1 Tax=Serpentinicella alkaliphila TaxID=1734049 RepID=A0A4R2THY6_9FIRM|nr:Asp-tRNA(Asn)/Glu-tRNA(Gln) amidotransferase subunit GatB [Serpentinicella alkaliphila]QUH25347.1 Asp-tRNA(Asn)/Glu-tRNA(Gln) amidotransferase subunit GatB [Serpentinicella alkaliphila]TCQ02366.1 aspartyl/glutamyl-tRNA(Asn/Gln) amidotransferase subunit B [Serpentinicella alkaliphila]